MKLRIALTVVAFVLSACGNDKGPSIIDSNNDPNNGSNATENSVNGGTNSAQNNNAGTFPGYVDGVECASDGDCAGTCNIDSVCEGGGDEGVLPDGEACTDDAECAGNCGDSDVCEDDPMGSNNDSNNANNGSTNNPFPGYVDGTECTSDSDCAGTCGGDDSCEGGGDSGVLPDGEACTEDADCAGNCGGDDTCEGDPYGGEGPNNTTNNGTNNNGTNGATNGTNNDTTGGGNNNNGGGNNVEDAGEGETGGVCPTSCPTPPQVPSTTACDGCAEGRCRHTSPFDLYCTRECDGTADCADLGTDWTCDGGSCVL